MPRREQGVPGVSAVTVSAAKGRRLARALEAWFAGNARDLPWRRDRDGYTALVSEAMLQQTQVARVVEKYRAFLRRFPTVQALAAAEEQAVLTAWQGLGYYRRARNLHAAAKAIVTEHGGKVPADPDALRALPGIGRYTAGAIASIAFGVRTPLVDGNVHRVLARIFADDRSSTDREATAWTWRAAGELVAQADQPGALNEALMELGATVCTARAPACASCPLKRMCEARRGDDPERYPAPKPAAARPMVHHHAAIIRRGQRLLFEQRPATGLWAGMWQTPTVEATRRMDAAALVERLAVPLLDLQPVGTFEHGTTHRRITFHVFIGRSRARRGTWRRLDDLDDLPLSNAQRRVLTFAAADAAVGRVNGAAR